MKTVRTIFNYFAWGIVIIYTVLIIMFQLPFVQKFIGSEISSALSTKLGTEVSIGKVNLGFLNRIIIDDITIYDQKSKMMIRSSRMAAKIDYSELLKNGRIFVSSAQAFGFKGYFYKTSASSKANYQFMLDSLASKDKSKKTSFELSVNSLIIRHGSFQYDRYDIAPTPSRFNVSHINIQDISAHLIIPYYTSDSISLDIKKLSLKEASGFELKNLGANFSLGRSNASLSSLSMELPETDLEIINAEAAFKRKDGNIDFNTLRYKGEIRKSKITLSDIACFVPSLKTFDEPVYVNSIFSGTSNRINISRLDIDTKDKSLTLRAKARAKLSGKRSEWAADISRMECDAAKAFTVMEEMKVKGIPDFLPRLGMVGYKGVLAGGNDRIYTKGEITTAIGNAEIAFGKEPKYIDAEMTTDGMDLQKLLADNRFGHVTAAVKVKAKNQGKGLGEINIDGKLTRFDYNGYQYKNITVNGVYDNKSFTGKTSMDDPNGQISIEGTIDIDKKQVSGLTASIRGLNPNALNLTGKRKGEIYNFDMEADVQTSRSESGYLNGRVDIRNFIMTSPTGQYRLDNINIESGPQAISMTSDFGKAEINGRYDISTMAESFRKILHSKLPTLCADYGKSFNKFDLNVEIYKTDWLEKLFGIPLSIKSPVAIKGLVDDENGIFDMECKANSFSYDGSQYEDAFIVAQTPDDTLSVIGKARKVMGNGHRLDLDISAKAANDKLKADIGWNNHEKQPIIGSLRTETCFSKDNNGKTEIGISVLPSEIMVKDSVWNVRPAEITYNSGNLSVKDFSIENNRQHIKIHGMATKSMSDSIIVDLQDVDVNYVLNLVNFHSVEFGGLATGTACMKSVFYNPEMYADIKVNHFLFEDGRMGVLSANVKWNKEEKQIDIDACADDDNGATTLIKGYVSPAHNFIDLGINANATNIEFLESFCGSFMNNVQAKADGKLRLTGPLNNINLTGKVMANGKIGITPLNTTYELTNDTIVFIPDNIIFRADTIRDRNGNIGIVDGVLHHEHLTKLSYDLNIKTHNMLCYDTKGYGNETFYGTAYGTGNCSIQGGNGHIDIDIDITPEKGSFIEYNATSPDAISDRQFISWNDKTPDVNIDSADKELTDTLNLHAKLPADDIPSDMRINFIVNMTPDATLRVLMDKTNNDYIALNGTGSIRATYFNKGSFDMFGTYLIDHGTYKLTIQNIIKKEFRFQQGGTIVFGGNPYNAALNMKALYTVNSVPLSDLQIGNSFTRNNVRVDCIMNIGGTPQSPHVDFDLDMPTVSEDAEQMVRTVINSEEEMNQQVVYLLSIGRFYMQRSNNSSSEEQQNQTSLAMQSLLSGTISQQINSLLGNLVKNNNWTFGANISTGDEGFNNAEYEGLLSGHLFNNRLIINGQFGYRDNANATTSFIGDFDISYLLLPNGNIALKVYNQTSDRYFTKSSLNTQGIGIIMKKDFNSFWEMFRSKKK